MRSEQWHDFSFANWYKKELLKMKSWNNCRNSFCLISFRFFFWISWSIFCMSIHSSPTPARNFILTIACWYKMKISWRKMQELDILKELIVILFQKRNDFIKSKLIFNEFYDCQPRTYILEHWYWVFTKAFFYRKLFLCLSFLDIFWSMCNPFSVNRKS